MRAGFIIFLLALCVSCGAYAKDSMPILANNRVEASTISLVMVSDIFLGRVRRWQDSSPIVVVLYDYDSFAHKLFLSTYLGGLDFITHQRRIASAFSSARVANLRAPIIVDTDFDMLDTLRVTVGSIGYFNGTIYLYGSDGLKRLYVE